MGASVIESVTKQFLAAYEDKDLKAIAAQLAENVVSRDWNSETSGKASVLDEFAKNFESASSIKIQLHQLLIALDSVAAEIEIDVDGERLSVVDVLTFDDQAKIISIISYRGL